MGFRPTLRPLSRAGSTTAVRREGRLSRRARTDWRRWPPARGDRDSRTCDGQPKLRRDARRRGPRGTLTLETEQSIDERFFADLDRYPFEAVVGGLQRPVMIVHGADDASVSIEDSFQAAALEADVLFEKVHGEGHRFSRPGERRLRRRLFDWLASLAP